MSFRKLGETRSRVVSRFRAACSNDLATRLAFGPTLVEPVGFAMDRRMLLGVKDRDRSVDDVEARDEALRQHLTAVHGLDASGM